MFNPLNIEFYFNTEELANFAKGYLELYKSSGNSKYLETMDRLLERVAERENEANEPFPGVERVL